MKVTEGDGHVQILCDGQTGGECPQPATCMWCDGGLSGCSRCGAFEGAWPDECPGAQMTYEQSDDVYTGKLNYRDGQWRKECCQVMRPAYDTDAYMAEHGYRRDVDGRWVRVVAS